DFIAWRDAAPTLPLRAMAAYQYGTASLTDADTPERIDAARVSEGYFDILGMIPMLGRTLGATDAIPASAPAAVTSERLSRRTRRLEPRSRGGPSCAAGIATRQLGLAPLVPCAAAGGAPVPAAAGFAPPRHPASRPWGAPGACPGDVSLPPTEVHDDWRGVTV